MERRSSLGLPLLLVLLLAAIAGNAAVQKGESIRTRFQLAGSSNAAAREDDDFYLQHVDNFISLLEKSAKQASLEHRSLEHRSLDPNALTPLPSEIEFRSKDPYERSFNVFKNMWKIRDFALALKDIVFFPARGLYKLGKLIKDKLVKRKSLDLTKEQLIQHVRENCKLIWQPTGRGDWEQLNFDDELLAPATKTSQFGVFARACVDENTQKQFLFAEYKFVKTGEDLYTGEVEPDDDVPLMAVAGRRGAIAFEKASQEFPKARKGIIFDVMMNETREGIRQMFPWAAKYVEDKCNWEFNTAGNGIAQVCYVYGSMTENIVFWGSPIGNRGFSGSYDSKVWDHMLTGVMKTFEAGHTTGFVQLPGQFHLLERWSGNYYTINDDCYMLDYVQGNVAQSMKFALIVPTQYYTLDYRSTMRTICQCASLVLKNTARQGIKAGFQTFYKMWKSLIKKNTNLEEVTTADCLLLDGLPVVRPKFKVGSSLRNDEIKQFALTRYSKEFIENAVKKQKSVMDPIDDDSLHGRQKLMKGMQQVSRNPNLGGLQDFEEDPTAERDPFVMHEVDLDDTYNFKSDKKGGNTGNLETEN